MGRATGAALATVVPEAAVARKIVPGMSAKEVRGELQRRRQARAAGPGPTGLPAHVPTAPAATRPAPASPGAGPSLPQVSLPAPVQTGSGFLLGLFAWACGLAYLRGGAPEVKRFMAAKFLNKTS